MKKFEPQYRLVRVGLAIKPERASRQQRASPRALFRMAVGPFGSFVGTTEQPLTPTQASSARTGKRPSRVPRRSRARRSRRPIKRISVVSPPHPTNTLYSRRYPGYGSLSRFGRMAGPGSIPPCCGGAFFVHYGARQGAERKTKRGARLSIWEGRGDRPFFLPGVSRRGGWEMELKRCFLYLVL